MIKHKIFVILLTMYTNSTNVLLLMTDSQVSGVYRPSGGWLCLLKSTTDNLHKTARNILFEKTSWSGNDFTSVFWGMLRVCLSLWFQECILWERYYIPNTTPVFSFGILTSQKNITGCLTPTDPSICLVGLSAKQSSASPDYWLCRIHRKSLPLKVLTTY